MISVSVAILTYNPDFEELIKTLESIISQKFVNIQIVVSDDGSEIDYFKDIEEYMQKNDFTNYVLVKLDKNSGTVKNLLNAVSYCKYEYIKDISPGDYLSSDEILYRWINKLIASKKEWSFGDAIYYSDVSGENIRVKATPQNIECYNKMQDKKCIWNYVILNDIALGATMVCKKSVLIRYLQLIDNKVVYAEDNIFRLMMFDGIVPYYISEDVVLYEYGSGVSTSGSTKWAEKLEIDWKETNRIMEERVKSEFQRKMINIMKESNNSNILVRKILAILKNGNVKMHIKRRFFPRMTNV